MIEITRSSPNHSHFNNALLRHAGRLDERSSDLYGSSIRRYNVMSDTFIEGRMILEELEACVRATEEMVQSTAALRKTLAQQAGDNARYQTPAGGIIQSSKKSGSRSGGVYPGSTYEDDSMTSEYANGLLQNVRDAHERSKNVRTLLGRVTQHAEYMNSRCACQLREMVDDVRRAGKRSAEEHLAALKLERRAAGLPLEVMPQFAKEIEGVHASSSRMSIDGEDVEDDGGKNEALFLKLMQRELLSEKEWESINSWVTMWYRNQGREQDLGISAKSPKL